MVATHRVASISKLFTDTAAMVLVERGELDLDAPIQTYLPEFAPEDPYGVPITLRLLMGHRAGLVRESPVGHYFDPDEPTFEITITGDQDGNPALGTEAADFTLQDLEGRSHTLSEAIGRPVFLAFFATW